MLFWATWSAWSRVCLVSFLLDRKQATLAAMRRTSVSLGGGSVGKSASKWRRCGPLVSLVVSSWLDQLMRPRNQVASIAVSAGRMCWCWRTECTRSCVITKAQSISPKISVFVWRVPAGVCWISRATPCERRKLHASETAFWRVQWWWGTENIPLQKTWLLIAVGQLMRVSPFWPRSRRWSRFCVWGGVMNWCNSCGPSLLLSPVKWTLTSHGRGMRFWLVAFFATSYALIPDFHCCFAFSQ